MDRAQKIIMQVLGRQEVLDLKEAIRLEEQAVVQLAAALKSLGLTNQQIAQLTSYHGQVLQSLQGQLRSAQGVIRNYGQAITGLTWAMQDIISVQGGWVQRLNSIQNNIPAIVMGLGAGPGLTGTIMGLSLAFQLALPFIINFFEKINRQPIDAMTMSVDELTKKIKELTEKKHKTEIDISDLKQAQEVYEKLKDSHEAYKKAAKAETPEQKQRGTLAGENIAGFAGGGDKETGGKNLEKLLIDYRNNISEKVRDVGTDTLKDTIWTESEKIKKLEAERKKPGLDTQDLEAYQRLIKVSQDKVDKAKENLLEKQKDNIKNLMGDYERGMEYATQELYKFFGSTSAGGKSIKDIAAKRGIGEEFLTRLKKGAGEEAHVGPQFGPAAEDMKRQAGVNARIADEQKKYSLEVQSEMTKLNNERLAKEHQIRESYNKTYDAIIDELKGIQIKHRKGYLQDEMQKAMERAGSIPAKDQKFSNPEWLALMQRATASENAMKKLGVAGQLPLRLGAGGLAAREPEEPEDLAAEKPVRGKTRAVIRNGKRVIEELPTKIEKMSKEHARAEVQRQKVRAARRGFKRKPTRSEGNIAPIAPVNPEAMTKTALDASNKQVQHQQEQQAKENEKTANLAGKQQISQQQQMKQNAVQQYIQEVQMAYQQAQAELQMMYATFGPAAQNMRMMRERQAAMAVNGFTFLGEQ